MIFVMRHTVTVLGHFATTARVLVSRSHRPAMGHRIAAFFQRWQPTSLAAVVSAMLISCGNKHDKDALDESLIQPVTRGDLVESIIESGKIAPWYEVKIKTKVSGEVKGVAVQEGETVAKGQLLMELDDRDQLRNVEIADTAYREAELNVKNAAIELERNQSAYEARGISKYELDRAQYALDKARVGLQRAKVERTATQDKLSYCRIFSPIDGKVTRRNVEPGEVVTAGITATVNGEPLLTIAQMDRLLLELSLNQVDVAKVKVDQSADVTLDAYRDKPVKGTVSTIAAAANTDATKGIDVFKIKVAIDPSSSDVEIKPGMTAEVHIHIGTYPDVLKVPIETVFEEKNKRYLYVVKPDPKQEGKQIKEKVEVEVGHRGAEEIEIVKGITEEQKIYTQADTKDLELKL